MNTLLSVKDLKTEFMTNTGPVRTVDGVSFTVNEGETLGIVGESGSGKSVTALSIMRLLPHGIAEIAGGEVMFQGKDLTKISNKEMRDVRGNKISMIFQDPMTSLNPSYTIGDQIGETLRWHKKISKKEAEKRSIELLDSVGISRPEKIVRDYPHILSGGMRQRVMIAVALACQPNLVIADEPTTALDVTIQAQIIELIHKMKQESKMSIIMITHDLGVVSDICDRVVVLYAGRVVEEADVHTLFNSPSHPYTIGLINSIPSLDEEVEWLEAIPGNVPIPTEMPKGCKFAPRCSFATERCFEEEPELLDMGSGQKSRCFYAEEVKNEFTTSTGKGFKSSLSIDS